MQYTAVIIDDEKRNIDILAGMLGPTFPDVTIVATAKTAGDGVAIINSHHPAIVFLDVQLPGKNGFELLKSLNDHQFQLIFVTAFSQYSIQAIRFAAIDYLLKPIDKTELIQAVQRAIQNIRKEDGNARLENLIRTLGQNPMEQHRIPLPSLKEIEFIPVNRIIRCEAHNRYTKFFIKGAAEIIVAKNLSYYDKVLRPYGFIRCHKSHLVNRKFVDRWIRDGREGRFVLKDGSILPIARTDLVSLRKLMDTIA
jgi:two-component system LytT family response regulator